jgi:hypothetical protein
LSRFSGAIPIPVSSIETIASPIPFRLRTTNASSVLGELHRIRQQVEDDLLDLAMVPPATSGSRGSRSSSREILAFPAFSFTITRLSASRLFQVEVRKLERHLAGLDLGEVEDVR